MNTTEIGDKLEKAIYELFSTELSFDRFIVRKEYSKIFQKKGYYSEARKKNIIFDLSIEVYLPDQSEYSLLILIECKNLGHSVPVDDAEEFWAKISQVAGVNTKGIIASSNSFAEGTINFSKSKGIGLMRYFRKDEFKWCLPRSSSGLILPHFAGKSWEATAGIWQERYISKYVDFHCTYNNSYTTSFADFFKLLTEDGQTSEDSKKSLLSILNSFDKNCCDVPYLTDSEIEERANLVLDSIGYKGGSTNLEKLSDHYTKSVGVRIIHDAPPEKGYLGKLSFNPHEICIFLDDSNSPLRKRFTLAHELGHLELGHSEYMMSEYIEEADFDTVKQSDVGIKDIVRMEYQANAFASSLLLPKAQIYTEFSEQVVKLDIRNRGYGILFLDSQPVNKQAYYDITDYLKSRFQVSRAAIKLRLIQLKLLSEAKESKSLPNNTLKRSFAADKQP